MAGKTCDWKPDSLSIVCLCQEVCVCFLSARNVSPSAHSCEKKDAEGRGKGDKGTSMCGPGQPCP
jgi:hypothetical protein